MLMVARYLGGYAAKMQVVHGTLTEFMQVSLLRTAGSSMFGNPLLLKHVGNMDLVRMTLQGICERSKEDGQEGFSEYATAMRVGR